MKGRVAKIAVFTNSKKNHGQLRLYELCVKMITLSSFTAHPVIAIHRNSFRSTGPYTANIHHKWLTSLWRQLSHTVNSYPAEIDSGVRLFVCVLTVHWIQVAFESFQYWREPPSMSIAVNMNRNIARKMAHCYVICKHAQSARRSYWLSDMCFSYAHICVHFIYDAILRRCATYWATAFVLNRKVLCGVLAYFHVINTCIWWVSFQYGWCGFEKCVHGTNGRQNMVSWWLWNVSNSRASTVFANFRIVCIQWVWNILENCMPMRARLPVYPNWLRSISNYYPSDRHKCQYWLHTIICMHGSVARGPSTHTHEAHELHGMGTNVMILQINSESIWCKSHNRNMHGHVSRLDVNILYQTLYVLSIHYNSQWSLHSKCIWHCF